MVDLEECERQLKDTGSMAFSNQSELLSEIEASRRLIGYITEWRDTFYLSPGVPCIEKALAEYKKAVQP